MAFTEERDEQLFDHGFLADDDLAQLGFHGVIALLELFDGGQFFGGQIRGLGLNDSYLRHAMLLNVAMICGNDQPVVDNTPLRHKRL